MIFSEILKFENLTLKNLKLLLIEGNNFSAESCEGFIQLIKKNKQLFIYNNWYEITEELGFLLVDAYIYFS